MVEKVLKAAACCAEAGGSLEMSRVRFMQGLLVALTCLLPLAALAQIVGDDAVMAAAIAKARAALPSFWERLERPAQNEENFAVRIRYATATGGSEDV